jgi:hypothetical protein
MKRRATLRSCISLAVRALRVLDLRKKVSGCKRYIQSEPPAQMRDAFHIHLVGERPHKEQFFFGADFKIGKFPLSVLEVCI